MVQEIERCQGCVGDCDRFYLRSANELLFPEKHPLHHDTEDIKHLLTLFVKDIGKCALTEGQISENIEGIVSGNRNLNG